MKMADKMFEELGYKIDIGENYGLIRYAKEEEYIRFYLDDEILSCNRIIDNEIYPLEIDSKLLKAIYKKCQELGWIE